MLKRNLVVLALFFIVELCYAQPAKNPVQFVDPFIGTQGDGNVFPGVSVPFGMVKLGPDCGDKRSNSGYVINEVIHGFSHIHVSGTGGGPKYGNILVMPFTGDFALGHISSVPENYTSSPGYFSVDLSSYKIHAELTSSQHAGFHKYTFSGNSAKGILIDAGSFLGEGHCCGEAQKLVGSEVNIVSGTRIEGYSRVRGGWNKGADYTVYFVALFDTPAEKSGTWENNNVMPDNKIVRDSGKKTGAYFMFGEKAGVIQVKVGLSFISTAKAFENIKNEINRQNFDQVRQNAENEWNKVLSSVKIEDDDKRLKTIFYTALYHAMLMPTDRTGENPKWKSTEPCYDDFYAIWDTFRATNPLLTLLQPVCQVNIIRSLIDIYKNEGFMPDARSGNSTGRTQGGSNCDVLIADAFTKGLKGIDYEKALESMIKNAEVSPGDDHQMKGRGGISDFNSLGYVSTNNERAGSRTVEYAYNDFCIYQVAKGLGKDSLANKYLQRSKNWQNLWKKVEDSGAQGFIMPKKANGQWDDQYKGRAWDSVKGWHPVDFTVHQAGTWPDFFYEADSWEYSFFVPHDVNQLIKNCGGRVAFVARLDTFFAKGYFSVSNEPSFFTPCLYSYVGRQDKTSQVVRQIISKNYNIKPEGIPGNDDSGSMSAWVAFHLMGFFPNAGQNIYLVTAPHFKQLSIYLDNGKVLNILAHNLSEKNCYVKNVVLNGQPLNRSWFRHNEIKEGGRLEFLMGDKPDNSWEQQLPPSIEN